MCVCVCVCVCVCARACVRVCACMYVGKKKREVERDRIGECEAETVVCVCEERWGTDVKDVEEGSVFADSEWREKEAGVPSAVTDASAHTSISLSAPPPSGVADLHNGIPARAHTCMSQWPLSDP